MLNQQQLSFAELRSAREQALAALVATSTKPDALQRLKAPAGAAAEVARNLDLGSLPAISAGLLYTGVLYDALDLAAMPAAALARARRSIVVTSALFGAVRLSDRLPPYRMSIGADIGLGPLARFWQPLLEPALSAAAGRGLIVDCRSGSYLPMWRPARDMAERWVQIRVPGASHFAKHTRGLVARQLCLNGSRARSVPALARELEHGFAVELHREGATRPWVLDVHAP